MITVLIAGIPSKLVKQARHAVRDITEAGTWDVRFFPSETASPQIGINQVDTLLRRAEEADGAHIIGFHQTGDRSVIAQKIRTHFRFRWGDAPTLWTVGSGAAQFREHMQSILSEEELWREHVRPQDKSSPLILPAKLFTPLQGHTDIWGECEMYGRQSSHYAQLAKKLKHFTAEHTKFYKPGKPSFMVDRSGLVWKDAGPYHATTPFPRRWKYSSQMLDKFHYDVEHQQAQAFTIFDASNKRIDVKTGKHANIDCHGYQSH